MRCRSRLADALVRWHRMRGFETAFLTGYDHAGISTQNAVEKHLATEGKTRQELGREAFVELVWEWLRQYGRTIMGQFRRMGASMDYRRERFTMDDEYVRAVMRFFVHLYRRGLDLPRRTGSSTGARSTRRRSPTSSSCTRSWTTLSPTPSIRSRTGPRGASRSRPRGRRRSSATLPSPCIPDDER